VADTIKLSERNNQRLLAIVNLGIFPNAGSII
jgi:hypothetical protein